MSTVERQVRAARRRLTTNVLLDRLAWGVLLAAGAWCVLWFVERAFVFGIPLWPTVIAAAGGALLFTLVGTLLAGITDLRAAVAVDKAAGLKERLSTALVCREAAGRDPFAEAALHDAERVAGRVHVPSHLPLRAPRLWPWSSCAVAAAALLGLFLQPLHLFAADDETDPEMRERARVEQQQIGAEVNKQIAEVKKLAARNPELADLASELDELAMPDQPLDTPDDVRREALKRLDKVAEKLGDKKDSDEMDALREMKRMMAKLEPQQGKDPGAQLSQALASGNFQSAQKAIDQMKQQIEQAAKSGNAQDRQQAAEMKKKLEKLAAQMQKLGENKQLQKDLENKAGLSPEDAKKMLQQLAQTDPKQIEKELQKRLGESGMSAEQLQQLAQKIQANQQAQSQCQSLGQCLAQAAAAMQQADSPGGANSASSASSALSNAAGQLSEMEMAEQMLNELEAQLNDLEDARDGVCQGSGNCPGEPSDKIGPQGPRYGRGYGARIGEQRAAHAYKPSKVQSQVRGGQIIAQMLIDGPQIKGEALAEVQEALSAAERDVTDPIDRDEVPRQYERVTREYFERLAGLLAAERKSTGEKAAGSE